MSIRIDEEFENLIPPLSPEEFAQLEENCVRDGIREPLVIWKQDNGDSILIDGHNRFRIIAKHMLHYTERWMQFKDRDEAKVWIIRNQFGRRNLSAYDRSLLALKLKPMIAEKAKENMLATQKNESASAFQKSDRQVNTAKELANIAGVSHDTIHKVEVIESKAPEALKQQVKSGDKSINSAYCEVMKKEVKRPPNASEYADQIKERHEDFKQQKNVTMDSIRKDKQDREFLSRNILNEISKIPNNLQKSYVLMVSGELNASYLNEADKEAALSKLNSAIGIIRRISNLIESR